MNSLLTLWHLLGWTMLYFLAAGTLVLLIGTALRVSLKRANPQIRYTTSLAVFAVLALLPVAIASWLTITQPSHQRPEFTTNLTNSTNQDLTAKSAENAKNNLFTTENTEITEGKKSTVVVLEETASISFESLLNVAVRYLPWLWCVGTPLTFLLLTSGLVGAERLRRSCSFLTDGPIHESCEKLRIDLGIGRQVGIAICERVATPLLVGVVKPLILLPPSALNGWTTDELEMVLLHELAHVRRWDNAVNLAQRIVESLLFFHPAVWIMSTWVRRDREDCCDAVVVGHTAKPQAYAELLLALASHQTTFGLAASAAMAQHPVANRIRRILKLEDEPMRVSRSTLTIVASTALALALGLAFLGSTDAKETVSRESKHVGDERSGEELTTNPTNRTNKNLTTEVTEKKSIVIEKVAEPGKTMVQFFPHPVSPEEVSDALRKLNQIGHNVTIRPTVQGTVLLIDNESSARDNDYTLELKKLIALKKEIQEQLADKENLRDDGAAKDRVLLDAEIAQLREIVNRIRKQIAIRTAQEKADTTNDDTLFYDGKTFEEWRNLWKTELKTEKRIECINALAAFGRAGKGQEAAEAILDVAGEYDFDIISDGSAGDLKQAITVVMVGNEGFPGQYWLPLLIDRLKSDPDKWSYFAYWVLRDVQGKDVIPYLKQLATDNTLSADARGAALAGLASQPDIADDPAAVAKVRKALQGNEPVTQILHQLHFNRLDLFPEQFELLFHKSEQVRNQALSLLRGGGFNYEPIFKKLLNVLYDPARRADHKAAIIALNSSSGMFSNDPEMRDKVTDNLTEILINGDPDLLPAALATLGALTARSESLVIQELGNRITDVRREQLEQAIKKVEELKAQASGRVFGGGGGAF